MNKCHLKSDQLITWSDINAGCSDSSTQASTQAVAEEATAIGCCASRVIDRALQALRQARLQVRQGSRTRTEVLFVGESIRVTTGNGLRAAGHATADRSVPSQLPSDSRHTRSALRDQSRVAASTRTVLGAGGERVDHNPHRHLRYHCRRDSNGQHAQGLAERARRFPLRCRGAER